MTRTARQALLLCGGKGIRMHWKTNDIIPKSLVQVNGQTLLSYSIASLPYPEIETIVFAVGHHADQIQVWVHQQKLPHRMLFCPDNIIGGGVFAMPLKTP